MAQWHTTGHPEIFKYVHITVNNTVYAAFWNGTHWFYAHTSKLVEQPVTAWSEFPKPYQEDSHV